MSTDRSEVRDIIPVLLHSSTAAVRVTRLSQPRREIIPQQAQTDEQLVALWLHGRPQTTSLVYRADATRLFGFVGKPLGEVALADLHAFADHLEQAGLAPATRYRVLSATKSLFGFACKLGYLCFDVGRALRRMLALEINPRDRVILMVLYVTGFRVSELASLRWRDCVRRSSGGQLTVKGKGGRTRAVLLPMAVWSALGALRRDAHDEGPVFASRKGGHLHRSQLMRIVARAARRAGIAKSVSPHWLRHAHVSHALDHGCPVHVVSRAVGHASLQSTTRYAHARPAASSSNFIAL